MKFSATECTSKPRSDARMYVKAAIVHRHYISRRFDAVRQKMKAKRNNIKQKLHIFAGLVVKCSFVCIQSNRIKVDPNKKLKSRRIAMKLVVGLVFLRFSPLHLSSGNF